jgi:hypothetical protein
MVSGEQAWSWKCRARRCRPPRSGSPVRSPIDRPREVAAGRLWRTRTTPPGRDEATGGEGTGWRRPRRRPGGRGESAPGAGPRCVLGRPPWKSSPASGATGRCAHPREGRDALVAGGGTPREHPPRPARRGFATPRTKGCPSCPLLSPPVPSCPLLSPPVPSCPLLSPPGPPTFPGATRTYEGPGCSVAVRFLPSPE